MTRSIGVGRTGRPIRPTPRPRASRIPRLPRGALCSWLMIASRSERESRRTSDYFCPDFSRQKWSERDGGFRNSSSAPVSPCALGGTKGPGSSPSWVGSAWGGVPGVGPERFGWGEGCAGRAACGWFSPFPGRVMLAARYRARGRCGWGAGALRAPGLGPGPLPAARRPDSCPAPLVGIGERVPVREGGATTSPGPVVTG